VDSDQGLVGPLCIVERGFELGRRDVGQIAVQAAVVVPVHPAQGGQLDVFDGFPGPGAGWSVDQLGLVVAVDGLGQGVAVAVSDGADRGCRTDLGEPFAVADGRELRSGIGVTCQARQGVSA
jgi:hypothetical protein